MRDVTDILALADVERAACAMARRGMSVARLCCTMSTKSKRRHARRHGAPPPSRRHEDDGLSPKDRRIAGELMNAILTAFSFGALAHER